MGVGGGNGAPGLVSLGVLSHRAARGCPACCGVPHPTAPWCPGPRRWPSAGMPATAAANGGSQTNGTTNAREGGRPDRQPKPRR